VLSLHYAPEPNFIVTDVAESLASAGAIVTVICPFPNYPFARYYDGKRHWWPKRTVEGGVTVWRVPIFLDHSHSKLRRFLLYMSFSLIAAVTAIVTVRKADVVWVYQSPFTAAIGGLWYKLFGDSRLVYTYADLWPESFVAAAVAKPGPLLELMYAARRMFNRAADVIIGSTRGTVDRFARDGVPASRLHFIPVWIPGAAASPIEHELANPPSVVYAGNLGSAQPLDGLVRGFADLHRQGYPVRLDVYGSGTEEARLRALVADIGAPNIAMHGRVTPDVAFRVSAQALAQVVSLRPDPLFAMTIPSKLLFSFAAGAPILYSLHGEAAEIARGSGAGIPFDAEDPSTVVSAVRSLLGYSSDERRRVQVQLREYYEANFAPSHLLRRYRDLILSAKANRDDGMMHA
jgi:colanic acid biosynthesis glycosyl transferase WcaI